MLNSSRNPRGRQKLAKRSRKLTVESLEDRRVLAALAIGDVSVSENTGTFQATITLSEAQADPVAFTVIPTSGTAIGGIDFAGSPADATIQPGTITTNVSFTVLQDAVEENTESFFLNLQPRADGSPVNATFADAIAEIEITDDDAALALANFRSIDGTGNNLTVDDLGAAQTQVIRNGYPAGYPDGGSAEASCFFSSAANCNEGIGYEITFAGLPNPRDVSNTLMAQTESILNDRNLSDWVVQWGQFLTHEISLIESGVTNDAQANGLPGDFSIPVTAPNDPLGPNSIAFHRSDFDPATGTSVGADTDANPREQVNDNTSFLDASAIYGSDPTRANALRTFSGGKLQTSQDGLLPGFNTAGLPNENRSSLATDELFLTGDARANQSVGLTATHTLFVREHNRLAEIIADENPTLSDEDIYQWARKIVGAQLQKITYEEFLPAIMGNPVGENIAPTPDPYSYAYNATVDASITNSFATAFFRFGHSMQSEELLLVDDQGEVQDSLSIREVFFQPDFLVQNPINVDWALKGLASQTSQEVDLQYIDDIRNSLFGPPGAGGTDLASLDIQRGRDHGLISYNNLRLRYGLEPLVDPSGDFSALTSDPVVQSQLQSLYGSIDSVEAIVGALAEDHLPGSSLGAMVHQSLHDQFTRLRDGDRFFYTGDPDLQHEIVTSAIDLESRTLADLIKDNTSITNLQDNVFFTDSRGPFATAEVDDVTSSLATEVVVDVTYHRAGGSSINGSTLGGEDIVVLSDSGIALEAAVGTAATQSDGSVLVRYTIPQLMTELADGTADGDYSVQIRAGQVVNNSGLTVTPGEIATFTIDTRSFDQPEASVENVASAGAATHLVEVTYQSDSIIDLASIDATDIEWSGPSGTLSPTSVAVDSINPFAATATYTFDAPGGVWDVQDNGVYELRVNTNAVTDQSGDSPHSDVVGSFAVHIGDLTEPETQIDAPHIISVDAFTDDLPYNILVTYTDIAFDTSSLGTGDIVVTQPDGTNAQPRFVSFRRYTSDGQDKVVATYEVPQSQLSANGIYQITIQPGEVADAAGNLVGQTSVPFVVAVPDATGIPTAFASARDVTGVDESGEQTFTVTFADTEGVNASWLGIGDFEVIQPDGTPVVAEFVSRSRDWISSLGTDVANPGNISDYAEAQTGLVITEIMYHPPLEVTLPAFEWIELYNNTGADLDFAANPYVLDDNDGAVLSVANIDRGLIPAGEVAVLFNGDELSLDFIEDMWESAGNQINFIPVSRFPNMENFADRIGIWNGLAAYSNRDFGTSTVQIDFSSEGFFWPEDDGVASIHLDDSSSTVQPWLLSDVNDGISQTAAAVEGVLTAEYRIPAPGGEWDLTDNGEYVIRSTGFQILDTNGNFIAAGPVGSFSVDLSDNQTPMATGTGNVIRVSGTFQQTLFVQLSDNVAIDVSDLDSDDIEVVGPDGTVYETQYTDRDSFGDAPATTSTYVVQPPGGVWTAADNGTYQIRVRSAQISDTTGLFAVAENIGSFLVDIADGIGPSSSVAVPNVTTEGSADLPFVVAYGDNQAINAVSIGDGDIEVVYPDGTTVIADYLSRNSNINARAINAVYSIAPRGGDWEYTDNGTYFIRMRPNEVSDASGNYVPPVTFGSFNVLIPDPFPPTATNTTGDLTQQTSQPHTIRVLYEDNFEVDASQLNDNDIQIVAPNGSVLPVNFNFATPNVNAAMISASYELLPPGGLWDYSDNGEYEIRVRTGEVLDWSGLPIPGGPIGSFTVDIADTSAPTGNLNVVLNIEEQTNQPAFVSLSYIDNAQVDVSTLGQGEIEIVAPNGQVITADFFSNSPTSNAPNINTQYLVPPPSDEWTYDDNGTYVIRLAGDLVADVNGNRAVTMDLGSFEVNVPDTDAPTAILAATTNIDERSGQSVSINVVYSDNADVDATSIDDNEIEIVTPSGLIRTANLSAPPSANAANIAAQYLVPPPASEWTYADNGIYTIRLIGDSVLDINDNQIEARELGSFTVNIPDTDAPSAGLVSATNVSERSSQPVEINVAYSDNADLDATTIGNGDIVIVGPTGTTLSADFFASSPEGNAPDISAQYRVAPPAGEWNFADSGTYTIRLIGDSVTDVNGNQISSAALGSFEIDITDTDAPTASLDAASSISSRGDQPVSIRIVYSDNAIVDATTIDNDEIEIVTPSGESAVANLVSVDPSGTSITATYEFAPPNGTWALSDNGTYSIRLLADSVGDTNDNLAIATTLGSFSVNLPDIDAPTATLTSINNITDRNSAPVNLQVIYTDDVAVDFNTLGGDDIRVVTPGGEPSSVSIFSILPGAETRTQYRFAAPDGGWTSEDNGLYAVILQSDSVGDTSGNFTTETVLGSFTVAITQPCDLTGQLGCDLDDLDALYTNAGRPVPNDQIVQWLEIASSPDNPLKNDPSDIYVRGDINLDGNVDSSDLGILLNNFQLPDRTYWRQGDLDGDGEVTSNDLGLLLNNFGFESPELPAAVTSAATFDIVFEQIEEDED